MADITGIPAKNTGDSLEASVYNLIRAVLQKSVATNTDGSVDIGTAVPSSATGKLNVKGENKEFENINIAAFQLLDSIDRVTAFFNNSGRMNLQDYSGNGAVAVLYNFAAATNGIAGGHYAWGTQNSAGFMHTIAYIYGITTDVTPNSMDSKLRFGFMAANDTTSSSNSYKQPNGFMEMSALGFDLMYYPLLNADFVTIRPKTAADLTGFSNIEGLVVFRAPEGSDDGFLSINTKAGFKRVLHMDNTGTYMGGNPIKQINLIYWTTVTSAYPTSIPSPSNGLEIFVQDSSVDGYKMIGTNGKWLETVYMDNTGASFKGRPIKQVNLFYWTEVTKAFRDSLTPTEGLQVFVSDDGGYPSTYSGGYWRDAVTMTVGGTDMRHKAIQNIAFMYMDSMTKTARNGLTPAEGLIVKVKETGADGYLSHYTNGHWQKLTQTNDD